MRRMLCVPLMEQRLIRHGQRPSSSSFCVKMASAFPLMVDAAVTRKGKKSKNKQEASYRNFFLCCIILGPLPFLFLVT